MNNSQLRGGEEFSTYGFPEDPRGGAGASGEIVVEVNLKGLIQLDCSQIVNGFSGGPLVLKNTNEVVGVINSIATNKITEPESESQSGFGKKNHLHSTVKIEFATSSKSVLEVFTEFNLIKPYSIFPPEAKGRYKALVVCHDGQKGIVEELCKRANLTGSYKEVMYLVHLVGADNCDEFKKNVEKAIVDVDCVIVWVCGLNFKKLFDTISPVLCDREYLRNKDIYLVNADCSRKVFKNEFQNSLQDFSLYPYFPGMPDFYNTTNHSLTQMQRMTISDPR